MRKFIITVNGKSYEVEVEEIKQDGAAVSTPVATTSPVPAPAPAPQVAAKAAPEAKKAEAPKPAGGPIPADAVVITAPMPGTILDVKVNVGDTVKKGQVLMILEAMKMENEIMSPSDGKVISIQTSKGSSVNAGDVLIALG